MKFFLTVLSVLLAACAISQLRAPKVDWMTMDEESPVMKRVPGGVVVAAAAAMQAVIERNGVNEFAGCRHAVDGLDATVFPAKEAPGEVFFVIVSQRFTACGDTNDERTPHWDEAYAVTADGQILERAQSPDSMAPESPTDGGGEEPDGGRPGHADAPAHGNLDGGAGDGGGLSRHPR